MGFEALSRMAALRILVLDDVEMGDVLSSFDLPHMTMSSWRGFNTRNMLFGFHLPNLAMLSWRDATGGVSLPFALEDRQTSCGAGLFKERRAAEETTLLSPEACPPSSSRLRTIASLGYQNHMLVPTLCSRLHSHRLVNILPLPTNHLTKGAASHMLMMIYEFVR